MVNLTIGNGNVLRDVNVEVASQIAGLLCGAGPNVTRNAATGPNANGPTASGMSANETTVNVSEITAQARQVDAGQMSTTTCNSSRAVARFSVSCASRLGRKTADDLVGCAFRRRV